MGRPAQNLVIVGLDLNRQLISRVGQFQGDTQLLARLQGCQPFLPGAIYIPGTVQQKPAGKAAIGFLYEFGENLVIVGCAPPAIYRQDLDRFGAAVKAQSFQVIREIGPGRVHNPVAEQREKLRRPVVLGQLRKGQNSGKPRLFLRPFCALDVAKPVFGGCDIGIQPAYRKPGAILAHPLPGQKQGLCGHQVNLLNCSKVYRISPTAKSLCGLVIQSGGVRFTISRIFPSSRVDNFAKPGRKSWG